MNRTFVSPQALLVACVLALVASSWGQVFADHPNYVQTTGYRDVLSSMSRLRNEGTKLDAGVRQGLITEGQSLVEVEESYRRGTTPIIQEIERSDAKSRSLASELQGIENRRSILVGDPKRTQAQIDAFQSDINDYNNRWTAYNNSSTDLDSRIRADTQRLESAFSAYANKVSQAFAAAPQSIDRIHVPSPEITAKSYVQLDTQQWSSDFKPLVTAANQALRKVQDEVHTAVVDELKSKALQQLENVPGYETVKSLHDRLELLNEAYAKPTLKLCQPLLDDIRRAVWELGDPNSDGSFADFQPGSAQRRHEVAQQSYKTAIWHTVDADFDKRVKMDRDWILNRADDKSRNVPVEKKVTHPDAWRNRWARP